MTLSLRWLGALGWIAIAGCAVETEDVSTSDSPATTSTSYARPWWTGTIQNNGQCVESDFVLHTATCNERALEQNWFITKSQQLESYKTHLCARPLFSVYGSPVEPTPCGDAENVWRFRDMEIVNGHTGYCVDVPAADYGAGKTLIQWPCHGGSNQRFDYRPQTGALVIEGWCLDAGNAANGAEVKLRTCDGTAGQRWNDARGGFVNATATSAPRCLALHDAKLVVSNCNDSVAQMWALRGAIETYDEGSCLTNAFGQMVTSTCNATSDAQRFTFWMQP